MGKTTFRGPLYAGGGFRSAHGVTEFYDDFHGFDTAYPATAESGVPWITKIVGAAPPTVAKKADTANGVLECALTNASQKQNASLYFGDQRTFLITRPGIFEAKFSPTVLATDVAEMVIGLVGDWVDGIDSATYSVFFTMDGGGLITCEMDDNATDRSTSSGVTLTAGQSIIGRIDFTDISDVKFYLSDVNPTGTNPVMHRVAASTTFAYAATGANATLQPIVECYKASGTGVGTLQVDYVFIQFARQ